MSKQVKKKRGIPVVLVLLGLLVVLCLVVGYWEKETAYKQQYPYNYQKTIEKYSEQNQLDPLLTCAFIYTESGFEPKAQSAVDARGLMQITSVTFEWIKSKIAADEDIEFDELYDPEINIRFGTYYLGCCMQRYDQDIATAAAAYHSGWSTVDNLLTQPDFSADGKVLDKQPYTQMRLYVNKISRYYEAYTNLYGQTQEDSKL